MAEKLISLWVFLFLLYPVKSAPDTRLLVDLFINGFSSAGNNMSLNGDAVIENNGLIRLTNNSLQAVGHAFYSNPIPFKNSSGKALSFSTSFVFAITTDDGNAGGHGLAFTISPTKELPGAQPGPYLGLFNSSNNGNFSNHIFAVELDTVQSPEFGDIDNNHVGIDINSLVSNSSIRVVQFNGSTQRDLNMMNSNGLKIQAWVEYNSDNNQLDVKISVDDEPRTPLLSTTVDLSPILLDSMYIGFSASTGSSSSSHYILGWSFGMNGSEARSLYLDKLTSPPTVNVPGPKKNNTGLIVGVSVSVAFAMIVVFALSFYKYKNGDTVEAWELDIGPHRFPYKELKKATRGFRDKELLGFGGFGKVYKGTLPNSNTQVAVKRISHDSKQGLQEFVSEISTIGRLRHRNLVQLLGWCRRDGDLLLVYDFMSNGSLDKYLFDKPEKILSWEQRFNIIKGVASGLLYLHEEWEQTVVHRDIKAGNVLLDSEFNGKLGDFGLAKLYEHGSNPGTTRVVGTLGYLAPELTRTGKPNTNSDVYAFGSVLLEVVCGRRPVDPKATPEDLMLVDLVWEKWRAGAILDVVDSRLEGKFDEVEVVVALKLGLICSNYVPEARPTMRQVVRYLEREVALPEAVAAPDAYYKRRGGEFDDYLLSFPTTSSYCENATTWSSVGNDRDADVERGSTSPLPLFSKGDGR